MPQTDRFNLEYTRRVEFSAAHSYTAPHLSAAECETLFGRSARSHAHGHNYDVRVTVRIGADSPIDPEKLDAVLDSVILKQLDHRHLNQDVPGLRERVPTLETLATFLWEQLETRLPGMSLARVLVYENPDFYLECVGEAMLHLTRLYRFSAAHHLQNHALSQAENQALYGKCSNTHGHDYVLEVTIAGVADPRTDCLVDIFEMDRIVEQKIIERFDHVELNSDTAEFRTVNPTPENILKVFWTILDKQFLPAQLTALRLWETGRSCYEYHGE